MATTAKKPTGRKAATPRAAAQKSSQTGSSKAGARRATAARAKDGTFKKSGSHWGTAAIVGGVAAVGAAATAALFMLRGSSAFDLDHILGRDEDETVTDEQDAHQPDGEKSGNSFRAKIADENTIPG